MNSSLDLADSIIVASSAPSKWGAYEETIVDFSVLAVFDAETWARLSSKGSGIWGCAINAEQIAAKLTFDE